MLHREVLAAAATKGRWGNPGPGLLQVTVVLAAGQVSKSWTWGLIAASTVISQGL